MTFSVGLMSVTFGAIQAGNVFSFVPDISSAKGAAEDMLRLVDSKPEIDTESSASGAHVEKASGLLQLKDVHFRYRTSFFSFRAFSREKRG